ncbi:MAG: DNA polymerase-3 subunit alpha [Glaciecola sp.]
MSESFVHLHVHTEYSMLDGASRIGDLLEKCEKDGQPAVAITDHGVLFGLVDFFNSAQQTSVKPILGCELYQAEGSRFDQTRTIGNDRYYHLTALASSDVGYQNLVKLSTRASLEGQWYKPRADMELLAEHSEGLVILSGCLGGKVNQALMLDDEAAAKQTLSDFKDIFGPERYFVEQMDHGIPEQRKNWPILERLAKDMGLRTVITNDSHYTSKEDAEAHDALLCIQTGSTLAAENRFRFSGPEYYVRSAQEMWSQFGTIAPDALNATLDIAEMCHVELKFGLDLLPKFPCPDGLTESEFLRVKVQQGAERLYGTPVPTNVQDRIDYELRVIGEMGFPAYFLIVADLCDYARDAGIRVGPGRGSAGGSVVAYCTTITQVDPIKHGLIFERFLNPSRKEMPDIDMDFDDRRRSDMIRYSAERYGEEQVAQVITFGTIKAKSAIRDAARVLDEPFLVGDNLAKMMPPMVQGRDVPLKDAYTQSTELREAKDDPTYRRVLDTAEKLEGLKRQHGIHAAAVIIGARPLTETVPLMRTDKGEIVTQYEMKACESIGLLKMDFLGLRNLSVVADAEMHVLENRGIEVHLDDPDFLGEMDDPKVYQELSKGNTMGIFQLDSQGMQALVRKLKPTRFEDISALLALYRPGPLSMDMHLTYADRKNGIEEVVYDHADLEAILGETYGVIVYQEQVMRTATDLAGFSMADADGLRKAVGKKKLELMASYATQFVEGGATNGYEKSLMQHLWALIEKFAAYGFNKAHTVAYGVISYQTAYLKAHFPVEYMAALLTSVKSNKDTKPIYLNECRRMGIPVLPPDVNASDNDFTPVGEEIRFGLSAVRGVGEGIVEGIVEARKTSGSFVDFRDFVDKVDASVLNKRTVEHLIKAGAFASMGHPRKGLLEVFEQIIDGALTQKKAEAAGQYSLFDQLLAGSAADETVVGVDDGLVIGDVEFGKSMLLAYEREMLGLYVSDHPLFGAERLLKSFTSTEIGSLRQRKDGDKVTVAGVLTGMEKRFTKKGDTYLNGQVEDLTGMVPVVFWPTTYRAAHEVLSEDAVLVVTGRLEVQDEAVKITADKVVAPDLSEVRGAPIVLSFAPAQCSAESLTNLGTILGNHAGHVPVLLRLVDGDEVTVYQLGDRFRVARGTGLFGEIKSSFGPDSVRDDQGDRAFGSEGRDRPWQRGGGARD